MQPRRPDSKKWTSIPDEYLKQINEVFTETFEKQLDGGRIHSEGKIYPKELLLRVGYVPKTGLRQMNFEISLDFTPKKDNMVQLIYLSIDCLASMMNEFFEDQEVQFPTTWTVFEVEGRKVHLMHSRIHSDLEAQADKILGDSNPGLVKGENEEEEKQAVKSMLGIDEED